MGDKARGDVYILHFKKKLSGHAGHYIGFSTNLTARLEDHEAGIGAAIVSAANRNGGWVLARVWHDVVPEWERCLKGRKEAERFCPICNPHAERLAHYDEKAAIAWDHTHPPHNWRGQWPPKR